MARDRRTSTNENDGDDMTTADENYDDDYSDYDAMDDDDDESGLSGFSVLMIGLVMFGAFAATTYVFYQKGIKQGERRAGIETPYVAADPEPIKIETADAGTSVDEREVYDVFDGEEPAAVTVIDQAPEEPLDRNPEDAIGELTADVAEQADAVIANLAEEDAEVFDALPTPQPEPVAVTEPTPVNATPADTTRPAATSRSAVSGSHVVQVGAFRSNDEALAKWSGMQSKIGAVLGDKSFDIERADLGDKGVYHRLRIGPFVSSDSANAYCASLKQNGQDCLPKKL